MTEYPSLKKIDEEPDDAGKSLPRGMRITLAGAVEGKHILYISVEDRSGTYWMAGREGSVEAMWLRATCSCGWRDTERFTIEDNAAWRWHQHTLGTENEGQHDRT